MARYNAWQNSGLLAAAKVVSSTELQLDRGAFFGSIFGTLNHLLWGDQLWMSRFDGGVGPACSAQDHIRLTPDAETWAAQRVQADSRIISWAAGMDETELAGDLTWHSAILKKEMTKPKAFCVTHFFNHQTHHRGQIHAMLTATGYKPQDTDLSLLPES